MGCFFSKPTENECNNHIDSTQELIVPCDKAVDKEVFTAAQQSAPQGASSQSNGFGEIATSSSFSLLPKEPLYKSSIANDQALDVDKGAKIIESLSTIEGTAVEKLEAFGHLLISDSYAQYASISIFTEDSTMFMVLAAHGVGSQFVPKHTLLSLRSSDWSISRVAITGSPQFWSSGHSNSGSAGPEQPPEDWHCLKRADSKGVESLLAVPIKAGGTIAGVLSIGLAADVEEQHSWWLLQLRLLAAVLAPYFQEAQMRSKVSWVQSLQQSTSVEELGYTTITGLYHIFQYLDTKPRVLFFHLALSLPGRPCAVMLSLPPDEAPNENLLNVGPPDLMSRDSIYPTISAHCFTTCAALLDRAVLSDEGLVISSTKQYLTRYGSAPDITVFKMVSPELPVSLKIKPLITVGGRRLGALYFTSTVSSDFSVLRRDVRDLVKIMAPTLEKLLTSDLSGQLKEICERKASDALRPMALSDGAVTVASSDGGKELMLSSQPERDMVIQSLQDQIRKQLTKVYRSHQGAQLDDLIVYEELGGGGFGTVYRGAWHGQVAAVKVVQDTRENEFLNGALELALMTSISHPNIIQIHTYFTDVNHSSIKFEGVDHIANELAKQSKDITPLGCQVMVLDFCDMGTLADILANTPLRHVTTGAPLISAILSCLLEIASAMQYLHSVGIVHYDLKPENVLLKSSISDSRGFTCKVGDFGLSHLLVDGSYFHSKGEGTVTHMAPESLATGSKLSRAVDIYAFGIIMWELYTGQRPYKGLGKLSIATKVLKEGMRPVFPSNTPKPYEELATSCWEVNKNDRPRFDVILDTIQSMARRQEVMRQPTWVGLLQGAYGKSDEKDPITFI